MLIPSVTGSGQGEDMIIRWMTIFSTCRMMLAHGGMPLRSNLITTQTKETHGASSSMCCSNRIIASAIWRMWELILWDRLLCRLLATATNMKNRPVETVAEMQVLCCRSQYRSQTCISRSFSWQRRNPPTKAVTFKPKPKDFPPSSKYATQPITNKDNTGSSCRGLGESRLLAK